MAPRNKYTREEMIEMAGIKAEFPKSGKSWLDGQNPGGSIALCIILWKPV